MLKNRFILLSISFFCVSVVLILRLAQVQLFSNKKLQNLENINFKKVLKLAPKRGQIFDAQGKALVINTPSYSLYANPKKIKNVLKLSRALSKELSTSAFSIYKKLHKPKKQFVWIARKLSLQKKESISKIASKAIAFVEETKRFYPYRKHLSTVLGFVDVDSKGLEGLELFYNQTLSKAKEEAYSILKDAKGRGLLEKGTLFKSSRGLNLELNIVSDLQNILEKEIDKTQKLYQADAVTALILDAQSSAILAMANTPGYDLLKASTTANQLKRNKAIVDIFEPGSTFKPFVVAAALKQGSIKPNSKFWIGKKTFKVGPHIIREAHKNHNFKWLAIKDILRFSSNIGMSKMALVLGDAKLRKVLQDFGFGAKTGVDFSGEVRGILQKLPWKPHLLANVSFGQGIAVSALQMANAYAAIANGGVLKQPHFVKAITRADGSVVKKIKPKIIRRVLSSREAHILKLLLLSSTSLHSTGKAARVSGYLVAGKTGTAQKIDPGKGAYLKGAYVSSFAGFFPVNDPKFVVYVIVDNPKGKKFYASQVAAPLFSKLAASALSWAKIPPLINKHQNSVVKKTKAQTKKLSSYKKAQQRVLSSLLKVTVKKIMPNLKNLSLREAIKKLQSIKNFKYKVKGSGQVYSMRPLPGTSLKKIKTIKLVLKHF
ncbi:MAG: transpeptidase family protein [Bdellovibrionaceae bacterium]|nr:transpeptidase family protein [Pseudobdellovibrionaceae bacterium]